MDVLSRSRSDHYAVSPGITYAADYLLAVKAYATDTLPAFSSVGWNSARKAVGHSDRFGKGVLTAFAGFLAVSALNGLLILILGNQHDTNRQVFQEGEQ